jgi:hypothetical protein
MKHLIPRILALSLAVIAVFTAGGLPQASAYYQNGVYGAWQEGAIGTTSPRCTEYVDSLGRKTGQGTIYASTFAGTQPNMNGPNNGGTMSYQPKVWKWGPNSLGVYGWRAAGQMNEMTAWSQRGILDKGVVMPSETSYLNVWQHGYYKVSYVFRWRSASGDLLLTYHEWSDHLYENTAYNGFQYPPDEVQYCTF